MKPVLKDGYKKNPKTKIWIVHIILILFITFISFLPSLNNGFTNWDDHAMVIENKKIKSLSWNNIKQIFTASDCGIYHPVTTLSFALEYHIFKLNPRGYHITSLTLHLLNCLFVYWLFFLLTNKSFVSFLISILFAIHPLHVESVAWISERKDVLYTFFFLLAVICYLYYFKNKNIKYYFFSLGLFLLSLLSKPMAVTLPVILILCDYLTVPEFKLKSIKNKIPFFCIALISTIVTIFVQKSYGTVVENRLFSFVYNIANSVYGLTFYIIKTILPVKLSALYPSLGKMVGVRIPLIILSFTVLIITVISVIYSKKYTKKIFFGSLFYLITILPVIQLIPVGEGIHADRYTYVPIVGLFYIFSECVYWLNFNKIKDKIIKRLVIILLSVLIIVLSVLTWNRCRVWNDSLTLWNNVIKNYDNITLAYICRGDAYRNIGEYEKAINDFTQAIKISPEFEKGYYNRANTYFYMKEYEKAINDYTHTLEINPNFIYAYYNRGSVYGTIGEYEKALNDFNQALNININYADAYLGRGIVYFNTGNYINAVSDFTKVINIDKNYIKAYHYRALTYYQLKEYENALKDIKILESLGYKIDEKFLVNLEKRISK